jgi:hypothetical protein
MGLATRRLKELHEQLQQLEPTLLEKRQHAQEEIDDILQKYAVDDKLIQFRKKRVEKVAYHNELEEFFRNMKQSHDEKRAVIEQKRREDEERRKHLLLFLPSFTL